MEKEFNFPKFQDNSFNRDEEFLNLLSDHSSEELKEIFEKSIVINNSAHLNKFCNDSLALISANQVLIDSNMPSDLSRAEKTYINNNDIIEKYTNKLLLLQQKLNENLSEHRVEKENMNWNTSGITEIYTNNMNSKLNGPTKVQLNELKEMTGHKKDVVVKKLLKTIDLMNQELSKRDKLILNIEKENKILINETKTKLLNKDHEAEISRLKQDILQHENEKEIIETKMKFLENKFSENYSNENNLKFKELENFEIIQRVNDELRLKIEKLSKNMKSDSKRNRFDLEVNEKYESLIKEKTTLEIENDELTKKLAVLNEMLNEKIRENEINFQEEITKCKIKLQTEINELKASLNENELLYKISTDEYENQMNKMNDKIECLEEERNALIMALNQTQDEKSYLNNKLEDFKDLQSNLNNFKEKYETANCTNIEQQSKIQQFLKELETKNNNSNKQSIKKCDELKRLKQSFNLSQERVKYLQTKHDTELQALKKQFTKDIENLKNTNDGTQQRNSEFSRSNGELRKKNRQLETDLKYLNEKYYINKQSVDLANKQKKELKEELERTTKALNQDFKDQISSLGNTRDEYLKKNISQQESIDQMLEQIASFKIEFDNILKRNNYLEDKVKRINTQSEAYKEKYLELKKLKKMTETENEKVNSLKTTELNLIQNFVRELRVVDEKSSKDTSIEEKNNYNYEEYQENA